jgi:hypothetical protein
MMNEDPIPELVEHDYDWDQGWSPDYLECRMFSPCQRCNGGGGGDEGLPIDPGPDHGVLFEVVDETPFTPMLIIPNEQLEPALSRAPSGAADGAIGPERAVR